MILRERAAGPQVASFRYTSVFPPDRTNSLLEAGDAESLFVLAIEDVGPVVREIFAAAELPQPEPGAIAALLDTGDVGLPLDGSSLATRLREQRGRAPECAPGWPLLRQALRSGRA